MTQDNPYWNLNLNLLKGKPKDILQEILRSDEANREQAATEFAKILGKIDKGLLLFIEVIQQALRQHKDWEEDVKLHAAMSMATSLFNYLLLARHTILMGYFSEARSLYRDCFERRTRLMLFRYDEPSARRFLDGKTINQDEVNKKLVTHLIQSEPDRLEIRNALKREYREKSDAVHPSLSGMALRTLVTSKGGPALSAKVGIDTYLGGLLSSELGPPVLFAYMHEVNESLGAIQHVAKEESGGWESDYKDFQKELEALKEDVMKNMPK